MIANAISSPTFRFLKVNDIEVEFPKVNPESYGEIQQDNVEIDKVFEDYIFGISPEALVLNKEKKNLQYVFDIRQDKPLEKLDIVLDNQRNTLLDNIKILANEDTKSEFLIQYNTKDQAKTFRNSILYIYAKKNSRVDIHLVTNQNTQSTIWQSVGFILEDNAELNIYQTELGVGKKLFSCMGKLLGQNSDFELKGSYLLHKQEQMDMLYNVDLYGEKSISNILVNGVQKDSSKKTFKGTLDFKKGSNGSVGSEGEYVTLLDKTVVSKCLPILLCSEDDVSGEHASSAGQLDEEVLFYIMSRGLSYDEAKNLMVKSRLIPVIDVLPDANIRQKLIQDIDEIMN